MFKALELGALDVLVMPAESGLGPELRQELLAKLTLLRALSLDPLDAGTSPPPALPPSLDALHQAGASTGITGLMSRSGFSSCR